MLFRSEKLAGVGVQRLELSVGVDREEYEEFLAEVLTRIVQSGAGGTVRDRSSHTSKRNSIKFGAVMVREEAKGITQTCYRRAARQAILLPGRTQPPRETG